MLLFSPVCLRMRSVALLLVFILALSDAADCQSFTEFQKKHILPIQFNTKDILAWRKHLLKNKLCERTETQSFIKSRQENIKQICTGSGEKKKRTIPKVQISLKCTLLKALREQNHSLSLETVLQANIMYIIVKCEKNLPVHYHGQHIDMNTSPQPCF